MARNTMTIYRGHGGWWCKLTKKNYFMERGPYRYRWMARMAFPISRWTR